MDANIALGNSWKIVSNSSLDFEELRWIGVSRKRKYLGTRASGCYRQSDAEKMTLFAGIMVLKHEDSNQKSNYSGNRWFGALEY